MFCLPPLKKIVHILPYAHRQRVKYGLDHFLDHFFYLLFWTNFFFGRRGGGWPLALRGRWDLVYQHSGRDGRKTVVTEGGVEDELSVRREGWEVYVWVTTTNYGVFIESYKLFWAVFRPTISMSKFLCWVVVFIPFLSCECETGT